MSLQSLTGNVVNKAVNTTQDVLGTTKAHISSIFGTVKTGFSNIWSGGFTGINEEGLGDLTDAIEAFCLGIETTINSFKQDANIDQAYKGLVRDAADEYVKGVKELLAAYVSTLRSQKKEANDYFDAWKENAGQLASQITSDAEQIKREAQSVRID